ncbi:hypothetical protein CEG14_17320 [Bordetella genomosp. 1]|uniref:VOC domain-containing protein n=1 Tax=Bordetella genomosp. 1 TaxID=1395607 RepID=A0A261S5M1_9BORD|nr:VOC family protein [Bordetella genomosp. 1]OZI32668.1 hypothetical protein CEG14_17320 [Bordetella genomosp. 1]
MTILGIDHFTIRTPDVELSARFYHEVVGLAHGQRPGFAFPGAWLYADGRPILHLVGAPEGQAELIAYLGQRDTGNGAGKGTCKGAGRLDHISLRASGLASMQERLLACGQPFRERVVPDVAEHQVFLEDPNGITIELIFPFSPDDRVVGERLDAPEMTA